MIRFYSPNGRARLITGHEREGHLLYEQFKFYIKIASPVRSLTNFSQVGALVDLDLGIVDSIFVAHLSGQIPTIQMVDA